MSVVNYKIEDDICLIEVNNPPVNAISVEVRKGLLDAVIDLEQNEEIKAVVICAPNRTFLAGADIREFGKNIDGPVLSDICNRLEKLDKIVVASLHGTPLGGGLEVAMSCHYRIATPNTKVGLPEVLLGIIPGAGGTQRLPRLAGISVGLEMMLTGRHVPASEAKENGIIDEIIDDKDTISNGIKVAKKLIANNSRPVATYLRNEKFVDSEDTKTSIEKIKEKFKSKHKNLFSPYAILQSVEEGLKLPFEQAIKNERKLFSDCIKSPQREGLIHSFFSERAVNKIPELKNGKPKPINKIGVIGGGTMGTGISMAALNSGFSVTMIEQDEQGINKALEKINSTYERSVSLGRISANEKDRILSNFKGLTDLNSLSDSDLIIEAVFEEMEIKKEVFTKLNTICSNETILASNTSYLNVN